MNDPTTELLTIEDLETQIGEILRELGVLPNLVDPLVKRYSIGYLYSWTGWMYNNLDKFTNQGPYLYKCILSGKRPPPPTAIRTDNHWQLLKAKAMVMSSGACWRCGAKDRRLELHHHHYNTVGAETIADVALLCHECHEKHHTQEATP